MTNNYITGVNLYCGNNQFGQVNHCVGYGQGMMDFTNGGAQFPSFGNLAVNDGFLLTSRKQMGLSDFATLDPLWGYNETSSEHEIAEKAENGEELKGYNVNKYEHFEKAEIARKIEPGDVLYRDLEQFGKENHYGVYIGDEQVIDFSQEGIQKRSFEEFESGYDVHVRSYWGTLPRDEIAERAIYLWKNKEEWEEYNFGSNNCEHFACYCATGKKNSGQVKKVKIAGKTEIGNEESKIEPGDVLYRDLKQFGMAKHYGVYIGDEQVIDFSQEGIQKRSFKDFESGSDVHVRSYPKTLPRDVIVERAIYQWKNKEEWGKYNLVFNNCEHFACFCATGEKKSGQVKKATIAGAIGLGAAVVLILLIGNSNVEKEK